MATKNEAQCPACYQALPLVPLRRCPRCQTVKPATEFYVGGRDHYCKPCRLAYGRDYYRDNWKRAGPPGI